MIHSTQRENQASQPSINTSRFFQEPEQFEAILAHAAIGLAQITFEGRIKYANKYLCERLGRPLTQLTTHLLQDLMSLENTIATWSFLDQMQYGTLQHYAGEHEFLHATGRSIWCSIQLTIVRNAADQPDYLVAVIQEITQQRDREQRLHARVQRLHTLIKQADTILSIVSRSGQIRFISDSIERTLGYTPQHVMGTNILDYLHEDDIKKLEAEVENHLPLSTQTTPLNAVCKVRGKDGWHVLEILITNLLHDPDVNGLVLNCIDITEQQAKTEQLQRQAYHDPLTSLPNRGYFLKELESYLRIDEHQRTAVLFLDLDRFKAVNDTLGHAVGDELLIQVARRLRNCVRPQDIVARLGGDEFTMLLKNVEGEHHAIHVAQRVIKALTRPFRLSGNTVRIGTSIGIALDYNRNITADEIVHNADVAMYHAKAHGRGRYVVHDVLLESAEVAPVSLNRLSLQSKERRKHVLATGLALGVLAYKRLQKKINSTVR